MARPDIAEVRKLSDGDITTQIDDARRELFTRSIKNKGRQKKSKEKKKKR